MLKKNNQKWKYETKGFKSLKILEMLPRQHTVHESE